MKVRPSVSALYLLVGLCSVSTAFTTTSTRSHDDGQAALVQGGGPLFISRQQRHQQESWLSESPLLSAVAVDTACRRSVLISAAWCLSALPCVVFATDEINPIVAIASSATAVVTDKIFVEIVSPAAAPAPDRIVIGLFGKAAPSSVEKIRQLVSPMGLAAPCRPRTQRSFQKEQLEANKVYNNCIDGEREGVSLRYSTVWRIRKDEGIDVGAVTGKFVAREYPTFIEQEDAFTALSHDEAGLVSVRRGNDSGFGFTISPKANPDMDADYIVVGRVLEGMDVVEKLNEIPVVNSAPVVNYMALTGGPKTNNAPDRSCRYGGPMYCNENKPLVKLKISDCGVFKMKK